MIANKVMQPIGIFDSGIGGLTIARAITQLLPNEDIIYYGDTAHLPYGDKSATHIQDRAFKICDFLLQKECKLIVIACNSASAAAFTQVTESFADAVVIFNVIDPVIEYVANNHQGQTIGLIGTWQTINSQVYQKKIMFLEKNIELKVLATPLLAPMIEEGFCNNTIAKDVINEYLSHDDLQNINALILGCTHYPIIKNTIAQFYHNAIEIIDSPQIVAHALRRYLEKHEFLNKSMSKKMHFYVSDLNDYFRLSAKSFFLHDVLFEQVVL